MRKLIVVAILGVAVGAGASDFFRRTPEVRMTEKPNGDYRLVISASRHLVCEEQPVTIVEQPDAVTPLIIECNHEDYDRDAQLMNARFEVRK